MTVTESYSISPIARIHTDLPSKFGIPRQSGLADRLQGRIVFEKAYRSREAVRGLEEFSHLWLIWQFSANLQGGWSPTVRPPRLGGNERKGVFATRSPFRPNALGLSVVQLEKVAVEEPEGPVLYVRGEDLMDGTPIFDIKPYIPYSDSHPEALGGFTDSRERKTLQVVLPETCKGLLPEEKEAALLQVLAQDPRPAYQKDPDRIYGFPFAGFEVKFQVADGKVYVRELIGSIER